MPYLTTKKTKATTKPWFTVVASDIQPGNGVDLFWDTTHTHTHLLSPDPSGETMDGRTRFTKAKVALRTTTLCVKNNSTYIGKVTANTQRGSRLYNIIAIIS